MRWSQTRRRGWTFRETGRLAYVIEVRSTAKRDTVHFRFVDEAAVRAVSIRSFLERFERAP